MIKLLLLLSIRYSLGRHLWCTWLDVGDTGIKQDWSSWGGSDNVGLVNFGVTVDWDRVGTRHWVRNLSWLWDWVWLRYWDGDWDRHILRNWNWYGYDALPQDTAVDHAHHGVASDRVLDSVDVKRVWTQSSSALGSSNARWWWESSEDMVEPAAQEVHAVEAIETGISSWAHDGTETATPTAEAAEASIESTKVSAAEWKPKGNEG